MLSTFSLVLVCPSLPHLMVILRVSWSGRCWMILALAAVLGTVPSTGSLAEMQASMQPLHGRGAIPSILRDALDGMPSVSARRPAPCRLQPDAEDQQERRRRASSLAAVGIASSGKLGVGVETVTLRGHEIPLYLRGVLSGFAGGLAGSSVSFLLHPLDTLKTMKQANTGVHLCLCLRLCLCLYLCLCLCLCLCQCWCLCV